MKIKRLPDGQLRYVYESVICIEYEFAQLSQVHEAMQNMAKFLLAKLQDEGWTIVVDRLVGKERSDFAVESPGWRYEVETTTSGFAQFDAINGTRVGPISSSWGWVQNRCKEDNETLGQGRLYGS